MSAAPSHLPTPYPQPSDEATKQMTKPASGQVTAYPTKGEGVKSQVVADTDAAAEHARLLDSAVAIEAANISTNEAPHRPLWERVGERGC